MHFFKNSIMYFGFWILMGFTLFKVISLRISEVDDLASVDYQWW